MKEFFVDAISFLVFRKKMVYAWRNERKSRFRRKLFFIAAIIAALTAATVTGALLLRKAIKTAKKKAEFIRELRSEDDEYSF